MFKSKRRPIVIPQSEHQRLAGALALLWSNAGFARPPVPFASFVAGVALHDRAYGPLDNLPIGELPEQEWLALTQRGFDMTSADPIADLIVKMHLQRLTGYGRAPARQTQAAAMALAIDAQAAQSGLASAALACTDRITRLCDDIAFAFCFELPADGAVQIFPHCAETEEVAVRYQIDGGTIQVDPWPFSASSCTGYLVGYPLAGYPDVLEPLLLPYIVLPAPR